MLGWSALGNKKFPFLFCDVPGEDMRDPDSPSFFNPYATFLILISD